MKYKIKSIVEEEHKIIAGKDWCFLLLVCESDGKVSSQRRIVPAQQWKLEKAQGFY